MKRLMGWFLVLAAVGCDGVLDDAQGCGTCDGAAGLTLRASIIDCP